VTEATLQEETALPANWETATLGELTEFVTSGSRGWARYYSQDGPLFLGVGNLDRGTVRINLSDMQHVRPPEGAEGKRTRIESGDILLSITADVGMVGLAPPDLTEAYVNQHIALMRPLPSVDSRALAYAMLDPMGLQRLAREAQYGATKPGLSLIQVRDFPVLIPPLNEQHRIIDAIESYLTRLDDAVTSLERVKAKLKQYRASVLKAAVEGRLVPTEAELAQWEGRHYEPASVLLERILTERRRRWEEAELARLAATGKMPKDDGWKRRYREPVAPDTTVLPRLPEGWCWATADMVADLKGGITKGQRRTSAEVLREVPYLRVANVQRGCLDLSVVKTIAATEAEIEELRLRPGDVLFNEGGDRDKLGRGWIWSGELPECIHQNHVFRARIFTNDLHPTVLSWYGNTAGQRYFFAEGKQTTNLASINLTKLRHLPVPIPPLQEQVRMTTEVKRVLSLIDECESLAGDGKRRVVRLRQSILKWAFEGRLVDQDPTEEPASILLERIRASRQTRRPQPGERRFRSRKVKTA
jgi:type I restriction enzyme S subunit